MRHRSVQSRAGILTAAAVMAVAGFGVSAAQANLVLDLKFHDTPGASSMSVAPNAVVNLDVFGTVTGSGAVGLQDAFFGVTNSGTVGNLSTVTLNSPFTGVATDVSTGNVTTSSGGTLYGPAGGQSVGSTDSSVADGWVFARSTAMTSVTSGTAKLLGTLTFTAGTTPGSTNLALNTRSAVSDLVIPAIWQENGAEVDTGTGGGGTLSTSAPLSITIASATRIPGDTNGDGHVDLTDLNNVLNNFGNTGTSPGDDNGDSHVDLTDLNRVLNNFGNAAAAAALSTVPEPASLSLLGLGAAALVGRRRRR